MLPKLTMNGRSLISFWLLGLCNNYAYNIMLSAAKDIMDRQKTDDNYSNSTAKNTSNDQICESSLDSRHCSPISTSAVLLANSIPVLIISMIFPFFIHRIPFGIRHAIVIASQTASLLIVAFSTNISMSLLGVVFAGIGAGFGAINFLALSSYFDKNVISTWSSGTGAAGIISAFSYAALTEPHFAHWSPKTVLLIMLIVPIFSAFTFWIILQMPNTVPRMTFIGGKHGGSWLSFKYSAKSLDDENSLQTKSTKLNFETRLRLMIPLLKYMLPMFIIHIAEYVINQGLVELIFFDCTHSFWLSRASQYRWYQTIYQLGVFISRSSVNLIAIRTVYLPILAAIQVINSIFFFFDAIYFFVPHIAIIFVLIAIEGHLAGAMYVNTFRCIHEDVIDEHKEYSLSITALSDSFGIVVAGFISIPIRNFICRQPLRIN